MLGVVPGPGLWHVTQALFLDMLFGKVPPFWSHMGAPRLRCFRSLLTMVSVCCLCLQLYSP